MRLCIPTDDDRGTSASVAPHLGRAPFFTFVDVEDGTVRVIANPSCHSHEGACHHVPLLKAHLVDAVVCPGIGRRAAAGLIEAGVEVRRALASTVEAIVAEVRDGGAPSLAPEARCGGGHGHGHGHQTGGAF